MSEKSEGFVTWKQLGLLTLTIFGLAGYLSAFTIEEAGITTGLLMINSAALFLISLIQLIKRE